MRSISVVGLLFERMMLLIEIFLIVWFLKMCLLKFLNWLYRMMMLGLVVSVCICVWESGLLCGVMVRIGVLGLWVSVWLIVVVSMLILSIIFVLLLVGVLFMVWCLLIVKLWICIVLSDYFFFLCVWLVSDMLSGLGNILG